MSRKSISLAVIVLAAICFIAGWLSYEWVLHCVTAKIERRIVFTSVQETFNHRLMLSLSFALVGAITGFGALLSGRFSARYRYGRNLLILLLVAMFAVSGWIVVLTNKLATLSAHLAAVPGLPETSLLLSETHLYESGIFGSGCVLVMAIILAILPIDRSREASNHTSPARSTSGGGAPGR
jgi:hypothetical protein